MGGKKEGRKEGRKGESSDRIKFPQFSFHLSRKILHCGGGATSKFNLCSVPLSLATTRKRERGGVSCTAAPLSPF